MCGANRANSTGTGASPTAAITHIAIAEMLDGKVVDWMDHVTDVQYGRRTLRIRGLRY
jgi:hypothetical protein